MEKREPGSIGRRKLLWVVVACALGRLAAADVEVVVATAGPKADVGLANDSVGFMYHFTVSPSGNWWAGHFETDDSLDSFHMRGQGDTATQVIWTEGEAAPGGLQGTIRSVTATRQVSVDDMGRVAGIVRLRQAGLIVGEFVYRFDAGPLEVLAATGQSIAALAGANYGPDFLSPNIDANGVVAFYADNITGAGISTADDALTLIADGAIAGGQRKGVTLYAGDPLTRVDPDRYVVSTSGARFVFSGDTTAAVATDDVVVVGDVGTPGEVVLQEGVTPVTTAAGAELFDVASKVVFGGDDWFAAGDTVGSSGVVVRNGVVIASEGDPAPNGFNYAGDPIALAADEQGNYVWVWQTTNPDPERAMLMVYNGTSILLVEHDTFSYDVDNDGTPDSVRIDRLFDDFTDLELAGGYAYFMSELDTPVTTVFFGYGFLRVPVPNDADADGVPDAVDNCTEVANADQRDTNGDGFGNACDADLNSDCIVNAVDLGLFKAVFFSSDPDADFNGDGVVNVLDLGILKSVFFQSPGPSGLASCS